MGVNDTWGEYSTERIEAALRSRVVGYELFAFATTVPYVATLKDFYLARSALDACLVHARCCTEFLVGRVNRKGRRDWTNPNDVRPRDFLTAWSPAPANQVDYLDSQLPLIDKHLSHVTITRADLFGYRWDIAALDQAIFAVAEVFIDELKRRAPTRYAELYPWFHYATEAKNKLLSEDDDARASVDRANVRSGIDVTMMVPVGIPSGAWAAWTQRYMQEQNISWPTSSPSARDSVR